MVTIGKVKLKIAIGHGGKGGCIVEVVEVPDRGAQADVDEYGSWLEDFFHEGATPPKEAGLYLFDGRASGVPHSDDMYRYYGEFERINI